jgi:hypothetical protein
MTGMDLVKMFIDEHVRVQNDDCHNAGALSLEGLSRNQSHTNDRLEVVEIGSFDGQAGDIGPEDLKALLLWQMTCPATQLCWSCI